MDQFVRAQNVERYCSLLDRVTEESGRQRIIKLLAEEQQKQKDAGDPLTKPSVNGGRLSWRPPTLPARP
jgi:hypothetical protein